MADIKRKKSIVEYIAPWVLLVVVFVILVFVFNKDNTIKTYSENEVIAVLGDQDGSPNNGVATYLEFESLTIKEKNRVVDVSGSYKDNLTADVMKYIPKDTVGWKQPSSVVAVQVEKESYPAKLPSEYTPSDMIITEYFKRGTQPTEVSDRYAKLNDKFSSLYEFFKECREFANTVVKVSGVSSTLVDVEKGGD